MNKMLCIVGLMSGAVLSGCFAASPEEVDQETVAEAEQAICIMECYYAYYSDPAKTNLVGECERQGSTEGCWGIKTSYRSGGCWQTCN
ncbi:hypothetical protein WMF37_04975 [Sorangium sp. So ce291]|uniref:hypothetical protein n=1 Tax=Sorangium sp. So ce291 TaxID=3133294 RepID=UPI003F627DC5